MTCRLFGIRCIDPILSILILWLLFGWAMHTRGKRPIDASLIGKSFGLAALVTFPLAIVAHVLFNKATHLNCVLGLADPTQCVSL